MEHAGSCGQALVIIGYVVASAHRGIDHDAGAVQIDFG